MNRIRNKYFLEKRENDKQKCLQKKKPSRIQSDNKVTMQRFVFEIIIETCNVY